MNGWETQLWSKNIPLYVSSSLPQTRINNVQEESNPFQSVKPNPIYGVYCRPIQFSSKP